jgi:biopolymer transport protein ExbD
MNEKSEPSMMIVTLTSGGGVFAGEEEIGVDQLPAKLSEMKTQTNQDNLIIRADKTVPIDLVIKVIDAAKISNIEKFTIETEKEKL